MMNRRALLSSGAAMAYSVFLTGSAQAQAPGTQSGADDYRFIFGTPNYAAPSDGVRLLKHAQDTRGTVPRDLNLLGENIQNRPIIQLLSGVATPGSDRDLLLLGLRPELYHLFQWNEFSLDMTSLDHTTVQPAPGSSGPDPLFAEQVGPHRSSRALAIVHLAMHEAVNLIFDRTASHAMLREAILAEAAKEGIAPEGIDPLQASVRAALAAAASDTLFALYPRKAAYTELFRRTLTPLIGDNPASISRGTRLGALAAAQVLAWRGYDPMTGTFSDGSQTTDGTNLVPKGPNNALDLEPEAAVLFPMPGAAEWRPDPLPVRRNPKAIGAYWHFVRPFVLDPANLFLPPGPPAEGSARFEQSYADVRGIGGDPDPVPLGDRHRTKTSRAGTAPSDPPGEDNETFKGNFWAYDATALLCAPPRLYNMIATSIALKEHPVQEVVELARYLALVNLALADAAIAAWTAKYRFNFARPVTFFRERRPEDASGGIDNRIWTPLGAPTSNGSPDGANMTPPFPAYPSGHAVFGGAFFEVLHRFFCTRTPADERFQFVSDEYNGLNRGPTGEARPFFERDLASFKVAAVENARSRVYLGIHWSFDGEDGIVQGEQVGRYVVTNALQGRLCAPPLP